MRKLIPIFILMVICPAALIADSPLTSTLFWRAYEDVAVVAHASTSKGVIRKTHCAFLTDESQSLDAKLAVVSAIGWDFDGQRNAPRFLAYLKKIHGVQTADEVLKKGHPHWGICLAYLKALDNYFDVTEAAEWADQAAKRLPESYAASLIASLIRAQIYLDQDWCLTFAAVDMVRKKFELKDKDLNSAAIQRIFGYMDEYAQYCK